MKKMVYLAIAVVAMAFAACKSEKPDVNDPTQYCWNVTATKTENGKSETESIYFWGTGTEVKDMMERLKQEVEKLPGATLDNVAAVKSSMNETQCDDATFE